MIYLEYLLVLVDLLGMGGSCVLLWVDVGDWCDIGENGIMLKILVEGDIIVILWVCNEDRN